MKIANWLQYLCLYAQNGWQECREPGWIKRNRLYGATMYVKGKTFRYKIVGQPNWGQGQDPTQCYRAFRSHPLKKMAGLVPISEEERTLLMQKWIHR